MIIHLSKHAQEQIAARSIGRVNGRDVSGLVTPAEVLAAVARHETDILAGTENSVVIVKTFEATVTCRDGSNGDHLLAVVDPKSHKVCTVMLQRRAQVENKSKSVKYLGR